MKRHILAIATAVAALELLFGCAAPPPGRASLDRIEHIVVIYAENRSFDNLYGLFPGANGVANATAAQYTQVDRDGKVLGTLPPVWKAPREATSRKACSISTPGTPTVSPFAKRGYVDDTPYDTTSIIKFITRRFGLEPLPGVRAGAGDLTSALDLAP